LAVLNRKPVSLRIDGVQHPPVFAGAQTITLPRGHHRVTIE
jgi:hypothetical protein